MAEKEKKKIPKPKPWYLGWGLARFGGSALEKSRKERDEKMKQAQK